MTSWITASLHPKGIICYLDVIRCHLGIKIGSKNLVGHELMTSIEDFMLCKVGLMTPCFLNVPKLGLAPIVDIWMVYYDILMVFYDTMVSRHPLVFGIYR